MAAKVCKSLLSCKSIADEWENCKCKGQKINRINLKHQDGCTKHFSQSAHCTASMSQKMDTSFLSHSYKTSIYISYKRGNMGFNFLREKTWNRMITCHVMAFFDCCLKLSILWGFISTNLFFFFLLHFNLLSLEVPSHTLLVAAVKSVVLLDRNTQ